MYDLIGDIHGHAAELVQLLETLGYAKRGGIYRHPERRIIFLGDFIDRGPQIRQVLEIVRPMIESESALAVMGNHELNALAYHTSDPDLPGETLRKHSPKNIRQHRATVEQLQPGELASYLNWFRTLPLSLDLEGLRVVHASWDEPALSTISDALSGRPKVDDEFLYAACKSGNALFDRVEVVLKGKEATLPNGVVFHDKEGAARTKMRTRWYLPAVGHTYASYAFESNPIGCEQELDTRVVEESIPYPITAKPVFIGHYWLNAPQPQVLTDNVACLDYSVAKGGYLCAYRWNGEQILSNSNFVRSRL